MGSTQKRGRYPYSLSALPGTLASKWDSPSFAPYRDAFPAEYRASPDALTAHVQDLVARDVKASYLKGLQGLLWKDGYESGAIKAPLFADVLPALTAWHAAGVTLMIYSSGSVPAQKLLFQHTGVVGGATDASTHGKDITPLLSDYFDTVNAGPKTAAASYSAILAAHAKEFPNASNWLFLSDNVLEVAAAKEAGLQSYVVQRPGNAPLAASVADEHKVITTFTGLER
ncbi:2,3-diketo-5-methylthio-1-phosphopentane phosphatase [Sporothrix schenckii ATCC 58251]|uniref:2,3-diketo-5-methylthio-1-phosphopentane phosphatase n=1 Tax=Sporothrix schenckii (strain ATCC 58251 / de Perez 2211183) TaxID=1391915 RepID=U7PQX9_SPOS1|nr:2,3-diketo-5-methylthio-1-phosphopentane phosphatase [Sporothrix schenckii ATCC 58251]